MTPPPNGLTSYFDRRHFGVELSPQFDWIFNGEKFEICKNVPRESQPKLGFGSMHQDLSATMSERERTKFYAKLIARLAMQDRKQELKDLMAVLAAHENTSGFANNLAHHLETEIKRVQMPYPYQEFGTKIYDVIDEAIIKGPNRNNDFVQAFSRVLAPHLHR